nr:hypothetical protein [Tanacetum cinerariifolium]
MDYLDVPETYMQEFWATAMVHHHSIWFKMDNKKHIVNLESFRGMLHICPRLPGQTFDEPPFEEEIQAFLRSLRHSGAIRRLTDGFYHKRNVDFTYLLWEDFVYQVEHKDTKKSNDMYYPRNSDAYKEYYAVATGAKPSKTKASIHKTKSSSDTTVTPPPTTTAGTRLFTSAKGKQPATTSKAKSLTTLSESDRLRNEAQAENDKFLKTIDENMQKIIKEKDKKQVKVQVSKILSKIEHIMNEQLEVKVLTQSSNSSKTSYAVAADLLKMELKNILIEKIEGNKSIHRSNKQRNLYKDLIEAYKSDKIILDTYRDIVTLKRRRDDDPKKDKEPSGRSDRGSKRQREGKEPESASAPKEKTTRSTNKSTQGSKSQQTTVSESAIADEPMHTTHEMEEPSHTEFERKWESGLYTSY